MTTQVPNRQGGFTIVELMIATSVLAVLLLVTAAALLSVGKLYYKGLNAAKTQEIARDTIDNISKSLQLGNADPQLGAPNGSTNAFCIDTVRYSYIKNIQVKETPSSNPALREGLHALWRDTMKNNASCIALDLTTPNPKDAASKLDGFGNTDGQEILQLNMRLTVFDPPVKANGLYQLNIGVAYGDEDLLTPVAANGSRQCIGSIGDQFCAVSEFSTVVARRL